MIQCVYPRGRLQAIFSQIFLGWWRQWPNLCCLSWHSSRNSNQSPFLMPKPNRHMPKEPNQPNQWRRELANQRQSKVGRAFTILEGKQLNDARQMAFRGGYRQHGLKNKYTLHHTLQVFYLKNSPSNHYMLNKRRTKMWLLHISWNNNSHNWKK